MSTAAVHITTSQEKAQFGEQTCLKRRPKRTLNVMAMFDGMDMHPEKKKKKSLSKDNYRKEKQLKEKKKNHICNHRGTGQKRTRKATTEKVESKSFWMRTTSSDSLGHGRIQVPSKLQDSSTISPPRACASLCWYTQAIWIHVGNKWDCFHAGCHSFKLAFYINCRMST